MSSSNTTTDHDAIRRWVEERGGRPARVKGTGGKDDAGLIRIDFDDPDGARDDRLEEVDWDAFFKAFDESALAFLYQDKKADGEPSYFNKFVKREGKK